MPVLVQQYDETSTSADTLPTRLKYNYRPAFTTDSTSEYAIISCQHQRICSCHHLEQRHLPARPHIAIIDSTCTPIRRNINICKHFADTMKILLSASLHHSQHFEVSTSSVSMLSAHTNIPTNSPSMNKQHHLPALGSTIELPHANIPNINARRTRPHSAINIASDTELTSTTEQH